MGSCKEPGRSDSSNWFGRVLQWQSGGRGGRRKPSLGVDGRNQFDLDTPGRARGCEPSLMRREECNGDGDLSPTQRRLVFDL